MDKRWWIFGRSETPLVVNDYACEALEANGHDLETAVEMILRSSLTSTSRAEAPRVCTRHRCYN